MYSYLPFQHGPRRCIGDAFAFAQMKILIAGLVGNFRMGLEENEAGIEMVTNEVVLKPANEPLITVELLDDWE